MRINQSRSENENRGPDPLRQAKTASSAYPFVAGSRHSYGGLKGGKYQEEHRGLTKPVYSADHAFDDGQEGEGDPILDEGKYSSELSRDIVPVILPSTTAYHPLCWR